MAKVILSSRITTQGNKVILANFTKPNENYIEYATKHGVISLRYNGSLEQEDIEKFMDKFCVILNLSEGEIGDVIDLS